MTAVFDVFRILTLFPLESSEVAYEVDTKVNLHSPFAIFDGSTIGIALGGNNVARATYTAMKLNVCCKNVKNAGSIFAVYLTTTVRK